MNDFYDGSGYDATTVKFFDVAHEGAQVRAVAAAVEKLGTLRTVTPRSIIVLTSDRVSTVAAQAVTQLRAPLRQPVVLTPVLPQYAGALDIVVGMTDRGDDPLLARALITANKRGATTVFAGPARGPILEDVPEEAIVIDALPTTSGASPARTMTVVASVLDVLEENDVLVAERLQSLAEELDEDAENVSPERDETVNLARQLRDFLGNSRILHTGVGKAGQAAAEVCSAVFTTKGLTSGYVPLDEYADAQGEPAPETDIFHDPFLDGPGDLVSLRSIIWGTEESTTEMNDARSVRVLPSAAGPTGQALRMIVHGMAVTVYEAS